MYETKEECWRYIRASRHNPSGYATSKQRKLVYASAMKQAEQFFTTADTAGYEIKPILLYYGLNQAVRAMAAVGRRPRDPWTFSSHGVTCKNIDQGPKLSMLQVENQGQGALQMLADLCSSPCITERTELGDIWMSVPEGSEVPLLESCDRWSALKVRKHNPPEGSPVQRTAWLGYATTIPKAAADLGVDELNAAIYRKYPAIRILGLEADRDEPLARWLRDDGRLVVRLTTTNGKVTPVAGKRYLNHMSIHGYNDVEDSYWFHPCLGSGRDPQHVLVTWYLVLYALSMLARYQPATWTKLLDIDSSPEAPAIEYILDEAHTACIRQVRSHLNLLSTLILGDNLERDLRTRTQ